jgi:hypothetical protein
MITLLHDQMEVIRHYDKGDDAQVAALLNDCDRITDVIA